MSKITVTTIAGATSGADANTVKIESGDDLVVNTDTIFADASADKVGINTTAMDASLEVNSASSKINTLTVKTAAGSGGVAGIGFMAGQTTAGREKAAIFFKETNGGAHYTGDIVFAVASSSGSATQVAASDEVCRITPNGLAIGGTGAANTLDDYEEGTWTPIWRVTGGANSFNYTNQTGRYTKIGNRVFGLGRVTSNSHSGSGGGVSVQGFPFTATNVTTAYHHFTFGHFTGFSYTGVPYGYVNSNTIYADLQVSNNGSISSPVYPASSTIDIIFSFMYETDA